MHKYLRHFPHRSHFLLFFIQVTAAEGEASEEQSRELQLHQALLQCTGQAGEKMLGQELDRDGRTMAPGSGPADSLT